MGSPGATLETVRLPAAPDAFAPDGSQVRLLARNHGASVAHFLLPAGRVSAAVVHGSVSEIWYVVAGHGRLWRCLDGRDLVTDLSPGVCVTLPVGTRFQFRAADDGPLAVLGVTVPPWPGDGEARVVDGAWPPDAGPATPTPTPTAAGPTPTPTAAGPMPAHSDRPVPPPDPANPS